MLSGNAILYSSFYKILLMKKMKQLISRKLQKALRAIHCIKDKILGGHNYEVAWKMAKDSETKWLFCNEVKN